MRDTLVQVLALHLSEKRIGLVEAKLTLAKQACVRYQGVRPQLVANSGKLKGSPAKDCAEGGVA